MIVVVEGLILGDLGGMEPDDNSGLLILLCGELESVISSIVFCILIFACLVPRCLRFVELWLYCEDLLLVCDGSPQLVSNKWQIK